MEPTGTGRAPRTTGVNVHLLALEKLPKAPERTAPTALEFVVCTSSESPVTPLYVRVSYPVSGIAACTGTLAWISSTVIPRKLISVIVALGKVVQLIGVV